MKTNILIQVDMDKRKICKTFRIYYIYIKPLITDKLQIIVVVLMLVILDFWINTIQKLASNYHKNKQQYELTYILIKKIWKWVYNIKLTLTNEKNSKKQKRKQIWRHHDDDYVMNTANVIMKQHQQKWW